MVEEVFLNNTLLPLIRAGLELNPGSVSSVIDYQQLIVLGKRHSILPIIRQGLQSLGLTGEGYKLVDNQCLTDMFQFAYRDIAIETIYNCFENNAIQFIPLKGSVLCDLYPDKWMRTSCDIDILVREKDLERAINALEFETEFRFKERLFHDVSMTMPNVHLELHFSIKENMDSVDRLLSNAWEYAEVAESGYRCTFSNEYQLFHVIAHMAYHFVHGGLGIRPYIDLWLFRHKIPYDETIVRKMCDQCGIKTFYDECCYLSDVWLEEKKHSRVSKALEEYSIEGGVFGSNRNLMLSKKRKHKGIGFYISRLFVSNDALKEMYPNAKEFPFLLPYYQLRRWPQALLCKRKSVIQEIRSAQGTSDNDIEAFDQFMKSLGL